MLPTSIAGSMRIACPPTVSPASTRAHVGALEGEVAAGLHAAQVTVGLVGARDVSTRSATRLVEKDRHVRAHRADEAAGADALGHLLRMRGTERLAQRVLELDLVHPVVAAHEHHQHARRRPPRRETPSAARPRERRARARPRRPSSAPACPPARARRAAPAARPAAAAPRRSRRSPRSPRPAPPRSRPPRTAPCTRGRPVPPIIPTSDSTRYHSRPARSKIRS